MNLGTCVHPSGVFLYGAHKPSFKAHNLREGDYLSSLGNLEDGKAILNPKNFPPGDINEESADWIYEIPNPFPFRGVTYIARSWADEKAISPESIALPKGGDVSLTEVLGDHIKETARADALFQAFPEPVLLALAATSNDPKDLEKLARLSCGFTFNRDKRPAGLIYKKDDLGRVRPQYKNRTLFEVVANNRSLPDDYKRAMVLKPGVQGDSEIVGEWKDNDGKSHIFEYLRRNSYIPWGHYAANMADDSVRYGIGALNFSDIKGLRHLYYQRTYLRIGEELGIDAPRGRKTLSIDHMEELRKKILDKLHSGKNRPGLKFNSTLWGWNFGFDYAPTRYRLHASHQQIHQQFAMVPGYVSSGNGESPLNSFACGDLIANFIKRYKKETGKDFFETYIKAINQNSRMDGGDGESSLVVYGEGPVMLFVPKAQTSQWELQLMTTAPVGNVLEADRATRKALDTAMLVATKILTSLGARMITTIEYSKRLDERENGQRLIYSFLPRLPESPGAFSEAQLRWINGHYPEDFAVACRKKLPSALKEIMA